MLIVIGTVALDRADSLERGGHAARNYEVDDSQPSGNQITTADLSRPTCCEIQSRELTDMESQLRAAPELDRFPAGSGSLALMLPFLPKDKPDADPPL